MRTSATLLTAVAATAVLITAVGVAAGTDPVASDIDPRVWNGTWKVVRQRPEPGWKLKQGVSSPYLWGVEA